ncbi:unnamed protein product [Allacma fusca]|uniref:Uncharacterized protein n=1 Tax=Allacma fusca TaxID=39272 RepID=A0A8J2L5R7_9HEXA|nr:unnamed protein product [Allacma fusca]
MTEFVLRRAKTIFDVVSIVKLVSCLGAQQKCLGFPAISCSRGSRSVLIMDANIHQAIVLKTVDERESWG